MIILRTIRYSNVDPKVKFKKPDIRLSTGKQIPQSDRNEEQDNEEIPEDYEEYIDIPESEEDNIEENSMEDTEELPQEFNSNQK